MQLSRETLQNTECSLIISLDEMWHAIVQIVLINSNNSNNTPEYKYWKQSTNTANIVLLSANHTVDIFSC